MTSRKGPTGQFRKENSNPVRIRSRQNSTESASTTFPLIRVKTPSQVLTEASIPATEPTQSQSIPTSPFVRSGANVGRRRANAISLMDSPARQGHSHEMARIFQEAQAAIVAQDAALRPTPRSHGGSTLFGSTPRRRLDLQKQRTGYQLPTDASPREASPSFYRLNPIRQPSDINLEEKTPTPDRFQDSVKPCPVPMHAAQKPLPNPPAGSQDLYEEQPRPIPSSVESWLQGIAEDNFDVEITSLASTLSLPHPSPSSETKCHGPRISHTSNMGKMPARSKATARLSAIFNLASARKEQLDSTATTPSKQQPTRWIPRRIPNRVIKEKTNGVTGRSPKRSSVKFEIGPTQNQSSSSEWSDATTLTLGSISSESGSRDYHLGVRLSRRAASSGSNDSDHVKRDSGVALEGLSVKTKPSSSAERTPRAALDKVDSEVKPLTPEVEKYRKGRAPPRPRCASYFDEDVIQLPRLKGGYIETEAANGRG